MNFAMNAPGVSNTATLNALLKSVGLKYSDVDTVNLPFPDHVVALKNKAVDASASVEPGPRSRSATASPSGQGRRRDHPNHQIAVLLYSEAFAKQPDAARRFMRAYIQAVRFYNGALRNGQHDRAECRRSDRDPRGVDAGQGSRAIYKAITPTGMNPDGRVNVQSLADDLAFYEEQGLITGDDQDRSVVDTPSSMPW